MESPKKMKKSRALSFSIFEPHPGLNENPDLTNNASSRTRRASFAQQYSPIMLQTSQCLDTLINEASLNASKARAVNILNQSVEPISKFVDDQPIAQKSRKYSILSEGRTPTPSIVPSRKPSTAIPHSVAPNELSQNKLPDVFIISKPDNLIKNGPLSSRIIRSYLAYLTGLAVDNNKGAFLDDSTFSNDKILLNKSDSSSFTKTMNEYSSLPYFMQLRDLPMSTLFYQDRRTRTNSNSSSNSANKGVSFWFGTDTNPSNGYDSDSGTSVASITANRDTQIDQLREVVRRLDNEYGIGHESGHKFGLSHSGTATPYSKTMHLNHDQGPSLLFDELNSVDISRKHPDLTQVYGPLPHHRSSSRESSSFSNMSDPRVEAQSTKQRAQQLLANGSISNFSPLARSSTSREMSIASGDSPFLNTSASFSVNSDPNVSNSLLAAIDKRLKAQESNFMAPVSF